MVSRLKHENVVELIGYCVEGPVRVLAYEHASTGSLHDLLHGKQHHCSVFDVQNNTNRISKSKSSSLFLG